MNNVSKNGLDLVKIASSTVKGKFAKAFIATLIMFAPLIAICFIPYAGWAISLFLFGVFETGYIRYFRALVNDQNPSLNLLFSEFKTGWLETFLGTCMLVMFLLGTVLFIVPGIILIGYYSMSLFMAEHYKTKGVMESFKVCQNKMKGNLTSMLSYKSLFAVIYIVLLVAAVFGAWGIYALYATNVALAVSLGIVALLVFIIVFSIITVYYHASNEVFFQEVLIYDERKNVKKQPIVQQPVETVEEVKPVERKAAAKPATASKTAAKTTAVKSAAAKSTTKATSTKTTKSTTSKTTKK